MTEHTASDDRPEPTADLRPEAATDGVPGAAPKRRRWLPLAVVIAVLAVLAVAVVVLRAWGIAESRCTGGEGLLVDEEARICYAIPEGWEPMSEAETEEDSDDTGFAISSGLSASGDFVGLVWVYSLDSRQDAAEVDEEPKAQAEFVSAGSVEAFDGDHVLESEAFTINGHDAASSTATAPAIVNGDDPGLVAWARSTVVEIDGEVTLLMTFTMVPESALEAEGGEIASLNQIHESLSTR